MGILIQAENWTEAIVSSTWKYRSIKCLRN